MTLRPLWQTIRDERANGRTIKAIASDLEISPAFVQRIARRRNLRGPRELRGGWRGGRKQVRIVERCASCAARKLRELWEGMDGRVTSRSA